MVLGITFTPFVFIPLFGIQLTFFLLSLMVLLSGIFLIFRDSRLIRGFRFGYAFSAFLLFILATGVFRMVQSGHRDQTVDRTLEGSTSSVKVLTLEDGSRSVFIDGDYYFGTDINSRKEQILSAGIPFLIHPQINSALVIGFGTGITAAVLDKFDIGKIFITEIYPEIVRLSSDVFADENNDILTSSRVNISIDDARSFLIKTNRQFDVITFGADQLIKFPGRYTGEFYRICHDKLTDDGMMCQIIPENSLSNTEFLALYHSCADIFKYISFWHLSPSKLLMISSKQDYHVDFCRISNSFGTYNTQTLFESIKIYDPESFVAHMISQDELMTTDNSARNTDNMPLVEFEHKLHKNGDITGLIKSGRDYSEIIEFTPDCTIDSAAVISKIKQINQSLLRQVSPFSSKELRHDVDFFEQTGLLIRQYL
jgi:spermidine synthase